MIRENLGWGDNGKGDSVGRNAFAYICWPNQSWLKDSILQCVKVRDDSYVQFYRYPNEGADTMSRDHVGAILLALYINRDIELNNILENLPWRLSRNHTQTIDFWIWTKILQASKKWKYWLSQIFFVLIILQFLIILPWNALIRAILQVKKYDNLNLPEYKPLSGWRKKLSLTLYPQYALFLLSWQIHVSSNSILKTLTKNLVRLESGNIVIDHLLGKPINDIDYTNFKSCTSFIWSRRLDSLDDVQIEFQKMEYNDLNLSLLQYLYFRIDKIMIEYDNSIIESMKKNCSIIIY